MLFREQKYAWIILSYLWIIGFVSAIGRFIIAFYQPELSASLGVSRSFIGMAFSTNLVLTTIGAAIGGWLTDRYGAKKMMVVSGIIGIIGTLLIFLVPNAFGFFIGYGVLLGLANINVVTSFVLIVQWFSHHRAKALLINNSARSLGLSILTPLFVMNQSWLDWRMAYLLSFIIGCVTLVFTFLVIRENNMKIENVEKEAAHAKPIHLSFNFGQRLTALLAYLKNPTVLVVMIALFSCGFNMGTVEFHLMAIHQASHVDHAMLSTALSLLGIMELVGGLTFGFLLDRMVRTKALAYLYAIRIVAFLFLLLHFDLSPLFFSFIFGAVYLGAVPGGLLVASEALSDGSNKVGTQTGLIRMMHEIGGVTCAVVGGFLFDQLGNYHLLIGADLLLAAVSAIGYLFIYRQGKRTPAQSRDVAAAT